MSILRSTRLRRPLVVAAATVTAVAGGLQAGSAAGAATAPGPQLHLVATASSVTVDRYDDEGVYLDLGTYVTVDKAPFELRVTRKSYKDPVVAEQVFHEGTKTRTKKLPAGLVKDFGGLSDFLAVIVTDSAGKRVYGATETFCPGNPAGRVRPAGPSVSTYPEGCSDHPFTLGGVWGVEKGWAASTDGFSRYDHPVDLKAGTYTAKVAVTKQYRDLFGLPFEQRSVKVTVRDADTGGKGRSARARAGTSPTGVAPQPAAHRPTTRAGVPAGVPKPDLRALPAYGIEISHGDDGEGEGGHTAATAAAPAKDYLAFSATVWNAGPAPLVVDGFRTPGKATMDAYQYFYDAKGKQVGYTPTGTMEWDARDGHQHWHFTDFASYRLLGADKKEIVRSGKEAFCLADTDAIDYTVKNANWHPYNTDLATACGEESAISVREVLDVGSGDTYSQARPGQSFDISTLRNGAYYIQVIANPVRRLQEGSTANNITYRKVVLGGTPGARTVSVPAYDLINAP
jgi:Lysyl oxidase